MSEILDLNWAIARGIAGRHPHMIALVISASLSDY